MRLRLGRSTASLHGLAGFAPAIGALIKLLFSLNRSCCFRFASLHSGLGAPAPAHTLNLLGPLHFRAKTRS